MKNLRLYLIAIVLMASIIIFKNVKAATTVSVFSLPYVSQSTDAATASKDSGIITQTMQFAAAPIVGDAIVCTEGDDSVASVTPPAGFTQVLTNTTETNSISLTVWYHVVTATEGNAPLTFQIGAISDWFVECDDWHGTDPTTPIETNVSTAFGASSNSLALNALTPNEAGTIPVEVGAQAQSATDMSDPVLPNTVWNIQGTGVSGQELNTTQAWYPFSSAFTPSPSFASIADSVAASYIMRPIIGSYTQVGPNVAAATALPTAVSTSSATPPPAVNVPGHIQTWAVIGPSTVFNQNQSLTATQASNWDTYLEGYYNSSNQSVISLCSGACTPVLYYDITNQEVVSTGNDTSYPYHSGDSGYNGGTCPESSGPLYASSVPDESWFLHVAGTSVVSSERIGSARTSGGAISEYQWFANPGSSTLQNYISGVSSNCFRSGTGYNWAVSQFGGIFEDNVLFLPSHNWSVFGSYGYTQQKNVGTESNGLATNAYIYAGCTSLYSGTYCTTPNSLSSNQTTTLEIPSDTSYKNAIIASLGAVKHNAAQGGGQIPIFINGQENTDLSILSSSPVAGGIVEHFLVQNGAVQSPTMFGMVMDVCSTIASQVPSKKFVIWDTSPGTGTYAEGNANHQQGLRDHYGMVWMCYYPNIVSAPYMATAISTANGVWPFDFVVPQDPVQTAGPATFTSTTGAVGCSENYYSYFGTGTACTGGGARDPAICVAGTAPACVYRREFSHCYYNSGFNNNSGTDLGPCGVIINLSGAPINPSANGPIWMTNWNLYQNVLIPCTPNTSYISNGAYATGTATVCNGTTGSDVGGGGKVDFSTFTKAAVTSLANMDSVFYVATQPVLATPSPSPTPPSTAAQYITSATGVGACAASQNSPTLSQAPLANDLIILNILQNTNGSAVTVASTGFTQLAQTSNATFTDTILYKIASGGEGTSYAWTNSRLSGQCDVAAALVRGESTSVPFDASSIIDSGLTSTVGPFSTAASTPTQDGDLAIGFLNAGLGGLSLSSYTPSGATNTNWGDYSNHLLVDTNPGTSAYSMSITMTTANGAYSPLEALTLINPSTTQSTPAPTPTPTVAPTATPTPNSSLQYVTSDKTASVACAASQSTPALASTPQPGDLIILSVVQNTNGSASTVAASGFTTLTTNNSSSSTFQETLLYKIAGNSESTTYTYTDTLVSGSCDAAILLVRNENQTNPFDQYSISAGPTSSTGPFATSTLTPTQTGDLAIGILNTGAGGLTMSSYTPSTATDTGAYGSWSDRLLYEPSIGASPYSMSMTMGTANSVYVPLEALLLINPANASGNVQNQLVHQIITNQLSDGAILNSSTSINEYDGNYAAMGLMYTGNTVAAQNWAQWYINHLNGNGVWGPGCSIYDYTYSGGTETSSGTASATDSHASTFIDLARLMYQIGSSTNKSWVSSHQSNLECIASVMTGSIQANNLTNVKPSNNIEYLIDNLEVYRGLNDMAWLETNVFNSTTNATTYLNDAQQISTGLQSLWNSSLNMYAPSTTTTGTLATPSWSTWYPDSVGQLFPVLTGYRTANDKRAIQLYNDFNTHWPNWSTSTSDPSGFPWAWIDLAAHYMGDTTRETAWETYAQTTWGPNWGWQWYDLESSNMLQAMDNATAPTPAGPYYVQSATGTTACAASQVTPTINQPAKGDLIIIEVLQNISGGAKATVAATGFNSNLSTVDGSNVFQATVLYKIATGTEGGSYTWTDSTAAHTCDVAVWDIANENQTTPFDATSMTSQALTTSTGPFQTGNLTPKQKTDLALGEIMTASGGQTIGSHLPASATDVGGFGSWSEHLFYDQGLGTSSYNMSMNMTTANGTYDQIQTLLLINPANATTTSGGGGGGSSSPYTLDGCTVYTANDWFTTNLVTGGSSYVSNVVDPNSTNIINHLNASWTGGLSLNINGTNTTVQTNNPPANIANSTTPYLVVQSCIYGCDNDHTSTNGLNDDPSPWSLPWASNFLEPLGCPNANADCHNVVIMPPNQGVHSCLDYETYQSSKFSYANGVYTAEAAQVHNLSYSYNVQITGGGISKAGLNYIGTVDFGEDASLASINHILFFTINGGDSSSIAVSGHVLPATGGTLCATNCSTYNLPFGARLRLKSSYPCPSSTTTQTSNPQAYKLCIQMKTYGLILGDHGSPSGHFGFPLAPSHDGTNPWLESDVDVLNNIPITDFEVMTLGTIQPD